MLPEALRKEWKLWVAKCEEDILREGLQPEENLEGLKNTKSLLAWCD